MAQLKGGSFVGGDFTVAGTLYSEAIKVSGTDFATANINSSAAANGWISRTGSLNAAGDIASFIGNYGTKAIVGAHNYALTAWAPLYVNNVDGSSGGNVYLPTSTYLGGTLLTMGGTATYAINSTKLWASDAPYTYGGATPYGMSMTYDGTRWFLQVSPASPSAVRVSYADTAGSAGSISGYNNPTAAITANTIVYRDAQSSIYADTFESDAGYLELCYYTGTGVRVGQGANGNKSLWASGLYDNGNRVYSAANPQVNISGDANSVDGQHFAWSNTDNNPSYLWGSNSNGSVFLVARSAMNCNYATSAGSAPANGGTASNCTVNTDRTDSSWYQVMWTTTGSTTLYSTANVTIRSSAYGGIGFNGSGWYIEGNASYGLYSNTGFYAAGGLWDAGNRVYSAGNPQGSCGYATTAGNANALGGYTASEAAAGSTIALRTSGGYIMATYFNCSSGGAENNGSGLGYVAGFNGSDTYIRSYNAGALRSMLGLGSMAYENTGSYGTFPNQHSVAFGNTNITASTSWLSMANMYLTVTPKGNKYLIMFSAPITVGATNQTVKIRISRDSSLVYQGYTAINSWTQMVSFWFLGITGNPGYSTYFDVQWLSGTSTYQNGSTEGYRQLTFIDLA